MSQFDRLVEIMSRLRAPDGCPWDKEQTHETLKPYLIEESYEVLDAIDGGDDRELADELGDVLLQVVFHAQLASETGRFTVDDVARAISDKLERRHPHVFGDVPADDTATVVKNWEAIKREENKDKGSQRTSRLDGVSRQLPALLRAENIQKKAARVGFDWDRLDEVTAKAREEVNEFAEALEKGEATHVEEELGDLLFSLVNVARFVGVSPEGALTRTNQKFIARFRYIEKKLEEQGLTPDDATLELMDELWEEAKSRGANQSDA
jgi:tetrapyrrole methylase family protein/MazG family protein